ncbi:MATE family efflux transporter [Clostridium sp. MCC353]|uniref:MATE family efflux transporter n=1 Tax=Clostridium sp. MCC353 TaxID=2592646 RepID=UPI001C00BDBE|nr:MATE family efflux transporter [Clostridium sp. MCC353]MBT9776463.1 MATE family efflux transporter [Clostridium sp. MCC353]
MKKNIDLLEGHIFSSLTGLALPIMATSLVQMAYNLTDMAWIGQVGSKAVAAVGAAGMYTWLSQGVVAMPKMGGQIKIAHSLGEGKPEDAAEYAKCAIQMGTLFALLFALIMVSGAKPLIGFFGLQDGKTLADAQVYLKITCGLIFFPFMNSIFTGILTATGDSKTPFKANAVGLVINMVMDPVLIFGIGPFPRMEVAGAAIATVLAQIVVFLVFLLAVRQDTIIFNRIKLFAKPNGRFIATIYRLGLPAAIQNLLYTSISMVLTRFVAGFGDSAVAVQRVGGQIESISWMTADGFAAAINSFVGQNYGGKKYGRVKKGYLTSVGVMFVWGLLCTALLVFLPGPIFKIFIREPEIIPAGIDYLRIIGYSEMFMCIELTTVGALSGLGKTYLSSIISITLTSARIPLAMLLSATALGLNGIWWALTISSVTKGIVFFFCCLWIMEKLTKGEAS